MNLKDFLFKQLLCFCWRKVGEWQQILHLVVGMKAKSRASEIVLDCSDLLGKGVTLCKSVLQANLDLFIRMMYHIIVLIYSKYLLSEAVAGHAYLIASNFANTQSFRFTEHTAKRLSVETDKPTSNVPVWVSHTKCVSPAVILFLCQSCPLFLWQLIVFPGSKSSKPLP